MSLLKEWRDYAYGLDDRTPEGKEFWVSYFQAEKGVYEQLLANPLADPVHGTVKELAEKYGLTIQYMIGFLDGIDDSLAESNNLDDVTEDSEVKLPIDYEKLYMNMVECNAEWLYTLPQWDGIFSKAKRDELYKIQQKLQQNQRKLEETIHVHVEADLSTRSAAVSNDIYHADITGIYEKAVKG